MSEQGLAERFELMLARMAEMQAELESLKSLVPSPGSKAEEPAEVGGQAVANGNTNRRRMLRRLAGGMLAGLAVGSVAANAPEAAQAKLIGRSGRVGAIAAPSAIAVSGDLPYSGYNYGLMGIAGTDITSFDLATSSEIPSLSAGVYGRSSSYGVYGTSTSGVGVYGNSTSGTGVDGNSSHGTGVYGTSGSNIGVRGSSGSSYGVYGFSNSSSGVYGSSGSLGSSGVLGRGNAVGVAGVPSSLSISGSAASDRHVGVLGVAAANFNLGSIPANHLVGVYGYAPGVAGKYSHAGYFDGWVKVIGDLIVTGNISKGGGSFKIDHPLDPQNKYLYHSFVESPDMMNIYNGIVKLDEEGCAEVELPAYFEALNRDFRYQLTCLDRYAPVYIAQRIQERKFTIGGGLPGQEVSWQVTGIRQDAWAKANPIPVEEDKPEGERGRLLYQPG